MLRVARFTPTRKTATATAASTMKNSTVTIILTRHHHHHHHRRGGNKVVRTFQNNTTSTGRQRRTFSSTNSRMNIMSTPTATPAPVGYMSMQPPRVVSRRAWQNHQQQQQQQSRNGGGGGEAVGNASTKTPTTANTATAEKPWPASVRYTGYAAAVTVIPYMVAWLVSYNPTLRSLVFTEDASAEIDANHNNKKQNTLQDYLRWQFGHEDEEEAQTTTRHEYEDDTVVPKQFPNELPFSVRVTQAAIRALEQDPVFVRIGIWSGGNNDDHHQERNTTTDGMSGSYLGDMPENDTVAYYYHLLPGSTPARIDAILEAMKTTASSTTSDNVASGHNSPFPPPLRSSVSLDFEDAVPPSSSSSSTYTDSPVDEDDTNATTSTRQQQQHNIIDPLLKQVACFSLWHYQDAAMLQAQVQAKQQQHEQQQNASSNNNNKEKNNNQAADSMELARLEYQVQKYQDELNNAASSLRAVDDIRHDLQESKAALKRLQRQAGNKLSGSWWSWSWR